MLIQLALLTCIRSKLRRETGKKLTIGKEIHWRTSAERWQKSDDLASNASRVAGIHFGQTGTGMIKIDLSLR